MAEGTRVIIDANLEDSPSPHRRRRSRYEIRQHGIGAGFIGLHEALLHRGEIDGTVKRTNIKFTGVALLSAHEA